MALPRSTVDREQWRDFGSALAGMLTAAGDEGHVVLPGLLSPLLPPQGTPTPEAWQHADASTPELDHTLQVMGESLGSVLTWKNQQDGAVVHNIVPTAGSELSQTGAGSASELVLHTEDAFHPDRADLVVLACVRNPGHVPTQLASVRNVTLPPEQWLQLARREVAIAVDTSYGQPADAHSTAPAVATVWNREDGRVLRFDPAYSALPDDEEFRAAYRSLEQGLGAARKDVALDPGDVLVIDNNCVVHGRSAFSPRFNGHDRWLKRVLVGTGAERHPAERWEPAHEQTPVVASRTGGTS
ncbi:TauD/TfdA family dioxygenase [Streptomyces sp. NBC_01465]|uniref:TauD/TfdA family dioxygenase n=1 Tax=Streptomyces sp. NBC_01465 TaxID=2903878 RepID=UPI002E36DD06|nr:TauD/TfdA family dioxygenase [Streptomyces sp. NBC_01465]